MTRMTHLGRQCTLALAITAIIKVPALGLLINTTFSSSVTSLSNASQVEAAFNYAAQQYQEMYTNPITINITVTTETTGLGNSNFALTNFQTYSTMRNALIANATTADQQTNLTDNWPTTDPTGTNSQWQASTAQGKALGLVSATNSATDGTFSFNTNVTYTFDPYDRSVATGQTTDFIGVAEHEISEIMGRTQGLGTIKSGIATYRTYDLSRYSSNGVHDWVPTNPGDYFSIDGGATNLKAFNYTAPGDAWDWYGPTTYGTPGYVNDSYNAFSNWDATNAITPVGAEVMDTLGYNRAATALTFKGGFSDFLTGYNWASADSTAMDPFHGATMLINSPSATAYHEFTPGENWVLASDSDMGQSVEVRAGFLELNDSGQVTGNGFGLLVNQDGELLVDGTGSFYPQGPVSIGDAAGVTNALAEFSGSGTVTMGNPAETEVFYVGNSGTGYATQTGAANVTVPALILGKNSGSVGGYLLNTTGTLVVTGEEIIGYDGVGDFQQLAGTNKITGALILSQEFGSGSYQLEGGTLDAASVSLDYTVFNVGATTFTQTGGTLNSSTVQVGDGATFNLSNGTCSASVADAGNFNFSGGLVIGNITNTKNFTYSGGSLIGGFTNDGVTNLDASLTVPFSMLNEAALTINSGITLTVNLSGIDNESTIILNGGTLAGNGAKTNDYAITGKGTISGSGSLINNGTIAESGGPIVLAMNGNPDYNYGAITLQPTTGELDLTTPNSPMSDRLVNAGMVSLDGSVVDGAAGFENASGGTVIGPGKINNAYFVNDAGAMISILSGTLNIVPAFSTAGAIELTDTAARLTGGAITNTGTIEGVGTVASAITNSGTIQPGAGTLTLSGALTNSSSGTISVPAGGVVLVSSGLATNVGTISLAGGTFDNNGNNISNQGQITGYGTFNATTLTSGHFGAGTIALSGGDSIFNTEVNNVGAISITGGAALFNGDVTSGAFIQATDTSVTIAGALSSYSYLSNNSANTFENNVSIIGVAGATMSGGDSDQFYLSGGTFTVNTNGAFSSTGVFESNDPIVNNGSFTQTRLFIQAANFTNSGTATIGGEQIWYGGTSFNNTAGTATLLTDAGTPGYSLFTINVTGGLVVLASPQHWTGLTIAGQGQVDVANNHIILFYTDGSDPISTIAGYLRAGYNGGAWNGPGIESSAAADNPTYGLGYADGADGVVAGLTPGEIEIAFTLYGDANLDGVVNGEDFTILASQIGKSVSGWDQGDFNYDGVVSGDDFTLLVSNLGKAANGAAVTLSPSDLAAIDAFAAANGLMADVPEPAGLSGLALGTIGVLSRRRRKNA